MSQLSSRHTVNSSIANRADQHLKMPDGQMRRTSASLYASRIGRAALMSSVAALSFAAFSTSAEAACVPVFAGGDLAGGSADIVCDGADVVDFSNGSVTLTDSTITDGDVDVGDDGTLTVASDSTVSDSAGNAIEASGDDVVLNIDGDVMTTGDGNHGVNVTGQRATVNIGGTISTTGLGSDGVHIFDSQKYAPGSVTVPKLSTSPTAR